MILDNESVLSDKQAITVTGKSTNVIDLGAQPFDKRYDVGMGQKVPFFVQVVEDFLGLTSLDVSIVTSDSEDLSSPVVASTATADVNDLVAGYQFSIDTLPRKLTKRYLGILYTVTGTATAGKITAAATMGVPSNG